MRKKPLIIIVAVLILDQLSKLYIVRNFYLGESVPVIKNIFHITYVTNTGVAFGMLQKYGSALLVFSIAAIITLTLIIYGYKNLSKITLAAFSLILGGAWGNIFDRIFRKEIVDFLDFQIWPVFNVADSAITIGIVMLFIHTIFNKKT